MPKPKLEIPDPDRYVTSEAEAIECMNLGAEHAEKYDLKDDVDRLEDTHECLDKL